MKIQFHKNFERAFKKLPKKLKEKTIVAIQKFSKNPFDKILRNHPLQGRLSGKRAFSVTGDMRVIFEEQENYILVIMLDVGTHNQIYN